MTSENRQLYLTAHDITMDVLNNKVSATNAAEVYTSLKTVCLAHYTLRQEISELLRDHVGDSTPLPKTPTERNVA